MAICHGQGDQRGDLFESGCCYVNGQICPNRLFVDWTNPAGDIFDSNRNLIGTVAGWADQVISAGWPQFKGGRKQKAIDDVVSQVQGRIIFCGVMVDILVEDPTLFNDRTAINAAMENHPDYVPVADAWEAIGKPRDWCYVYGPTEGQCCFREDEATNAARAANLSGTAVQLRGRGG